MNVLLKGLIAIIIFAVVSAIAQVICRHFNIDSFWGWLVGVIVGVAYFISGPDYPSRNRVV